MPLNILVVDDSAVVRGLVSRALSGEHGIMVAGTAVNGRIAVEMAASLQPDIIVLDVEMPVMDGLTALPLLLKAAPACKIIMASSLTQQNAAISIQAMTLGAADYIGKPSSSGGEKEVKAFYFELVSKVKALGGIADTEATFPAAAGAVNPAEAMPAKIMNANGVQALAIASSTGGPQALVSFFTSIKGGLGHIPIFITQHMPAHFTRIFAEHLAKAIQRPCAEAVDGEPVQTGKIYLAPGDYHMMAQLQAGKAVIRLTQDPPENFCRPSADPMLRSLSKIYGGHLAVLVLTGMGQDGLEGCREVVARGGSVVAQNASTCVVYGMPRAVAVDGLCKAILPLPHIGRYLLEQIDRKS